MASVSTQRDAEAQRFEREIADAERAAGILSEDAHDLKSAIDVTPVLLWSAGTDGELQSANQYYLDYVGLTQDQLREGWLSTVHPDDQAGLINTWASVLASGELGEAEARLRHHNGEYRWFLFRANPLRDKNGNIIKWYGVNTDIEDRKRAEEAVALNERNLRETINAIPTLAWCNRTDGSNEFLNKRWHDYTGLSPEEANGWGWQVALHPEDLPKLLAKWQHMLATGESGEIEARLRRFDGAYRWFLFRCDPLRDASGKIVKWYGTNTDIEDLKQAETELRRANSNLNEAEAILAQGEAVSETGSFLWDLETNHIRWSNQLYRIFEFEPGSVITIRKIVERVHPLDHPAMEDMASRAQAGLDSEYAHRLLMPDGSIKYLHFVAQSMRNQDGRLEYMGAIQDVTARRLAEQALDKVRSELAHAARAMSLGVLTGSIAHEVNQPLSGIITNANTCLRMLAADPPNVDGAIETARRTIRDGKRAAEVIARLRALFSKKEFAAEVVDLNEATREVIALSLQEMQRHHIELQAELAEDLPQVIGDRVQLQQVIINLILNASDAMKDVKERPRQIFMRTEDDGSGSVNLIVRDTGVGLAADSISKLFDAFYTTKPDGMGIGLSVSRSIIERHNGRLWASQNEGPGATFFVSIPHR